MVGQSTVDSNGIFQCEGSQVLLKLLLGLKSTGWCMLERWLTIYSVKTSFFLAAAE
jgi:hypothetical protein